MPHAIAVVAVAVAIPHRRHRRRVSSQVRAAHEFDVMAKGVELLRGVELLKCLRLDELEVLASCCVGKGFKRNEVVFAEGESVRVK
jgi:hypothetical protein